MRNSLRVGTVLDIGIYIHWTFLLLVAGILVFFGLQGATLQTTLVGAALIMALFLCVVLHELGHALAARRFDVPTRDITLYPIGGVARLQRIPDEPMSEFWIAIAGPAVNLAIAAVLFLVVVLRGGPLSPEVLGVIDPQFDASLMWLNIILFGFNLLPAFPMDGGRVLRALLATRISYTRATEIAANIGQGMAILFGVVGFLTFNPILMFIAIFVYIGAQQEARQAMMRELTEGISVRQAMMTRFRTLGPEDTLDRAVAELLAGADQDFPVVENGHLVGILTRKDLVKALSERGRDARLSNLELQPCATVEENSMLDRAFLKMQEASCTSMGVMRGDQLVGILTLENVGELMMISSALRRQSEPQRVARVLRE